MRPPPRSVIRVIAVLGALGLVVLGGAAAVAATQKLSSQSHSPVFIQPQGKHASAFRDAQAQSDSNAAAKLAKAMFTGDLASFNSFSAHPKARQQDLDADHERKDTLISGPTIAGAPTQDMFGNVVVHLTATAKAPSGKTTNWTLDIAVSTATNKVLSIDAHRAEVGQP
jgi:hypothetical protein